MTPRSTAPAYEPITEHADRFEQIAAGHMRVAAEYEARARYFRVKADEWRDRAVELREEGLR